MELVATDMTSRVLLMLDIDGVLHPASGQPRFSRLDVFEGWLRRRPSVDVVVASIWRARRSLKELAALFSDDLRARIVGVTPLIGAELWEAPPQYQRQAEVKAWLQENAPSDGSWNRWAALDDQPWLYHPFMPQVVAIRNSAIGVTESELAQLDSVLGIV